MSLLSTAEITAQVRAALVEDIGSGDINAALIPAHTIAKATIITRENAVFCGQAWANEVCQQIDAGIQLNWLVQDGEVITADQTLCELAGPARSLLTAERCLLNFLQLLSATATTTQQFVKQLVGTATKLLDTRKTIPGFRLAQKYAVQCGGGKNHRLGLYDAFLIKENHIAACGSITAAVTQARLQQPNKLIEVEVENLSQLEEALTVKTDIIMLDNFSLVAIKQAVAINNHRAKLEVSGNVDLADLHSLAATGVDYISVGALTKHVRAIDLSMRIPAFAGMVLG